MGVRHRLRMLSLKMRPSSCASEAFVTLKRDGVGSSGSFGNVLSGYERERVTKVEGCKLGNEMVVVDCFVVFQG